MPVILRGVSQRSGLRRGYRGTRGEEGSRRREAEGASRGSDAINNN